MIIEKRDERQIELWKKIIQELIKRPQIPCELLAWIIWATDEETQILVNDLEYRWSIEPRVNKNFLIECELMNIYLIQKELVRRLSPEQIWKIPLYELEKMLENALLRKWKIDWDIDPHFMRPNIENTTYIDKLLQLNPTNNGNYIQQNVSDSWSKKKTS